MSQKGSNSNGQPSKSAVSRTQRIWFTLGALILVPLVLLSVLEASLRLFGFGYPTSFFLERTENGIKFLIDNDKFGWRFFPSQIARSPSTLKVPATKQPGTYRIFVFGESAALGDPKPSYSVGRYLEVLLRERFPTAKFEVITVAMTAINSHAILPMARECARLEGDFWVIYMGNNEMQGPFGVSPISGPAAPALSTVRLSLALRATRLGQLAERLAKPFTGKSDTSSEWEGVRMFREHRVSPKDPKKEVIYSNFRSNLEDILKEGLAAGARPILCTVASNQRDFAPLASLLSNTNDSAGNIAFRQGVEFQATNLSAEAVSAFTSALPAYSEYAELHFRLGQSLLDLGSNSVAQTHFRTARDVDALPLRTDGRINELIREVAASRGTNQVKLVDADRDLGANFPAQVPGDETFFDHVHLTFGGNYRLARLIAAEIEKELPGEVAEKRALNWASTQACDRELGLTDWNRRTACENMLRRQVDPPFTDQSNHTNRIEALSRTILELREALTGRAATNATAIYEATLQRNPIDFRLRENFAEFLEATGKFKEAAAQRIQIAEYVPHDPVACYHAGRMAGAAKNFAEAKRWFHSALQLRPQFPEAHLEIGRLFANEGKHEEALRSYEAALLLRPDDVRLLIQRAHSLAALNRRKEAMEVLREAIKARPEYWEAHYLLAVELAANNRLPEAAVEFQEVTRLRPGYAQAHFNLAVALAKLGKVQEAYHQFQKTLEIEPEHKLAMEYSIALATQLKSR